MKISSLSRVHLLILDLFLLSLLHHSRALRLLLEVLLLSQSLSFNLRSLSFLLNSKCFKFGFSLNCILSFVERVDLLLVVFVQKAHIKAVIVLSTL